MEELPPPEPTPEPVVVNDSTMPGLLRAVRRRIDASQRELAKKIGVAQTTISRIEAGTKLPSFAMLLRILAADNLLLVVTDADGNVVLPMKVWGAQLRSVPPPRDIHRELQLLLRLRRQLRHGQE